MFRSFASFDNMEKEANESFLPRAVMMFFEHQIEVSRVESYNTQCRSVIDTWTEWFITVLC